ncbi:MAG TPA: MFS transporter [Planctomycetaceae bacterium]|nr:MFS transporter [Planctomycetaceae bacterium]
MSHGASDNGIAPNAHRLLWAGFMAILAAGVGFAIRGGILDNWGTEFGFTGAELGALNGAGFTGFCFGIIIGGVIADKIGYGKLVAAAFLFHVLSAVITFAAAPPPVGTTVAQAAIDAARNSAFNYVYWGTFLFAIANGTLEAVANPLIATLFPNNRTHYLNILHASWPAGLVLGSVAGWVLDDQMQLPWKMQLGLFLVPTVIYGLMFLGQPMPKSEASKLGLSLGEMFKDVGLLGGLIVCFLLSLFLGDVLKPLPMFSENPEFAKYAGYAIGGVLLIGLGVLTNFSMGSFLLFTLFIAHALVGAVELGTDGWIQNITANILSSPESKILFAFTSAVMFGLRFCADFIEKKLGFSPVAILLTSAILACIGLNLTSTVSTFGAAILALTVYGIGKTFFWPTMLAVASDRFPRTGAIAISMMGGIGMLSAGLIGSTGLGYSKDRFAGEALKKADPALYEQYKASKPSGFLMLPEATGLDGVKVGEIQKKPKESRTDAEAKVIEASITGDRQTLVADSAIPATMAVIYLCLLLYFKSIGGYKPLKIEDIHSGTDLGTAES